MLVMGYTLQEYLFQPMVNITRPEVRTAVYPGSAAIIISLHTYNYILHFVFDLTPEMICRKNSQSSNLMRQKLISYKFCFYQNSS
mgnify:FL=1